jgi:sugar/nucleoside kinase (ribokinase family)
LQLDVLNQVQSPLFVAADTMNFWISGERKLLGDVLRRIDTLVVNDEELRQLAETHNIKRAAALVRNLGPKRLVVKRGEYGSMLFDEHGAFFVPAFPLEDEVDPTGAGDSFAGGLLGYLAQSGVVDGGSLRRALMMASAVASFCVEGVGTKKLAAIDRDQVGARLDSLRALVHIDAKAAF